VAVGNHRWLVPVGVLAVPRSGLPDRVDSIGRIDAGAVREMAEIARNFTGQGEARDVLYRKATADAGL
jgi:hypothetical protein